MSFPRRVLRPAVAGAAMALLLCPTSFDASLAQSGALDCRDGFTQTSLLRGAGLEDVLVREGDAWAIGTERETDTTRRPLVMRHLFGTWAPMSVPTLGDDDGLTAIAGRGPEDIWAVGFTTLDGLLRPNAMHWDGKAWAIARPRPPGPSGSSLTDVAIADDGRVWAIGFLTRSGGGNRPIVVRRGDRDWRRIDPPMKGEASMTLRAVDTTRAGGLWVVGYAGQGSRVDPLILRHRGEEWQRMRLPAIPGEAVLTDVAAVSRTEAWAVGYQRTSEATVPLVLRWDGSSWTRGPAPDVGAYPALLLGLSVPTSGGVWAVGSRWDAEANAYRSLAAWWDGQDWSVVPSIDGGTELHGVAGAPDTEGWLVGRSRRGGVMSRVCPTPQVGLFGGSEPANLTGAPWLDHAEAAPARRGSQAPRHSASPRLRRARPLPRAGPHPAIEARDVARTAGIAEMTHTYGGVVADFDGDGLDDLFIGRHGGPGRLALNKGGTFRDHAPLSMPRVDRHGCAAADVDGSGLPDLLCTVGASRGSGLKANELWIDPGGPAPYDGAGRAGLFDPTGRGRNVAFLRHDGDAVLDVVVGNAPSRVDGLPSLGRLFRGGPGGSFKAVQRTGFDPLAGAWDLEAADLDRDGRDELLIVARDDQIPAMSGIRIYRNTRAGFVDATARLGVRPMDERDAHLVDVNGDHRADLVQLSATRLRISLWRRGRFQVVYERVLRDGRAVASGDVNGDGIADLYLVRGSGSRNRADIMLVNTRKGRGFRSMLIPQVASGDADAALAIDHDGNGLTDFVVLNGRQVSGPLQLVAFFPRESAAKRR